MKLSEWQAKPFLDAFRATQLGKIEGVYLTKRGKPRLLYVEGRAYALNDLFAASDALLTRAPDVTPSPSLVLLCLGAEVFTLSGAALGRVLDYDFETEQAVCEQGVLPLPLCSGTKNFLIINPEGKRLSRKRAEKPNEQSASAPETTKNDSSMTNKEQVRITPLPLHAEGIEIAAGETRAAAQIPMGGGDYSFLYGRKLTRDIGSLDRSFVGRAGMKIDPHIVADALKAGKIVELIAASSSHMPKNQFQT